MNIHTFSEPGVRVRFNPASIFRLIACVLLLFASASGFSHGIVQPNPDADLERLTQTLAALNARYHSADSKGRTQLLAELQSAAAERRQSLAALIQDNPGEVLRLALPDVLRAGMPAAVQQYLERQASLEGELEVLHVDDKTPQQSHYRYFLNLSSGEHYSMHFADHAPELLTGSRVRVRGVLLKGAGSTDLGETAGAMAADAEPGIETLAAGGTSSSTLATTSTTALPNTFGAQNTLVILVNFSDKATQPYTIDTARKVVFTTTSNFDLENSFQQTSLTGDVVDWKTIALSSTVCDYNTLASQAKQAATNAGYVLSNYTRYVYAFPDNACTWWGLGSVGGKPSQAWINGSLAVKVVGHEMGHNFGLYHAHTLECGTATLGATCTTNDYGDTQDMMGGSASGHFNTFEKERLGWLNYGTSPAITTVLTGGDYWLDPYETAPGANAKALKILKSTDPTTGKKTWYYVEYRQAIGFDSFLSSNSNVLNGVVVRTGSESSGNTSNLLDISPTSPASFNFPALALGQSFNDPDAGVTIVPTWMNGSNAIVNVSFGPLACVQAKPTLTLSPSASQWLPPGASATFTLNVTNKDNSACGASAFNLGAAGPSGWTGNFAQAMLSLVPGASASTTLTVTSPAATADGFYTIPVTASNSTDASYGASSSATVVIASTLNVTAATDKMSYSRSQSVIATTLVYANGSPVANAAVTFTFTKANGNVVTVNAATGANGAATATLRLGRKDPTGVYSVRADAKMNNAIFGSATANFTVQ